MGGIFSTPSAPPPALPEIADPGEEERKARLKAIERNRRGRAGMIKTSPRGIFEMSSKYLKRKSLLGE